MINERRRLEKTMKNVLQLIVVGDSEALSITEEQSFALNECYKKEYVVGVFPAIMANGNVVFDITKPQVTLAGLQFLYPYINWKFYIPTIIAAIETVVLIWQVFFQ